MGQDVIVSDAARQPEPLMAVGDPTRPAIRRAVFRSMVTAAVFFLLTGPVKQIKPLYNHAPWLNDPFDTVVSFMMFFVPFVTFLCAVRVWLCRTHEPLPLGRVRDILRACRVVLAAIAITAERVDQYCHWGEPLTVGCGNSASGRLSGHHQPAGR